MIKKLLLGLSVLMIFGLSEVNAQSTGAQNTPQNLSERYFKGEIVQIIEEGEKENFGYKNFYQLLQAELTEGPDEGKKVLIENGGILKITPQQKLKNGDKVVVIKTTDGKNKVTYSLLDNYRLGKTVWFLVGFVLIVILIAGKKGIGSLIGLGISFLVIIKFIVPQILAGKDPLTISIIGSAIILATTIYVAHGFSKRTSVAIVSTVLSLVITGVLAVVAVKGIGLSGLGSEDSAMLQFGSTAINLQGLLLGGIIIGALGVLDDITTAQSATVFEIAKANPKFGFLELFKRGYSVGKEHVASLVNTLVLAYAGASLAVFILFVLNPSKQPYWVILNSQTITEEVVRTISGSVGLILAVPITTLLAAWLATPLEGVKTKKTSVKK